MKTVNISNWGNYPRSKSKLFKFRNIEQIKKTVKSNDQMLIPRGNGRSYGDSSLGSNIYDLTGLNYFQEFNKEKGILKVQSGVLLSEILEVIIPQGWFLITVPGTKFITVGGAIASDIHGKNHHKNGCFSQSLIELSIINTKGKIIKCNKKDNSELFRATCGGQGLTGIIIDATIQLKPINSTVIEQTTIKTFSLKETFSTFEEKKNATYSVAWIDCLARGDQLGRSLISFGELSNQDKDSKLNFLSKSKINIPCYFPKFVINKWLVKIFNWLYFNKQRQKTSKNTVSINQFFFPLDSITNWNKIYGKKGFIQYQFILPLARSYEGMKKILELISNSGQGSFLAVLKLYGATNSNYLSFPMEGYSLALDFKMNKKTLSLLKHLDKVVNEYEGRIYLTKDSRISKENFEQGYPEIEKFRAFRKENQMDQKFQSLQSQRLGL